MSGRRSCVNSLWSGTERVRIGERLKATLAGVQELEFLRCKHLEMVDAAVDVTHTGNATVGQRCEGSVNIDSAASDSDPGSATSRRQQAPSPSDTISPPCQGRPVESGVNQGDGPAHSRTMGVVNSRWSTLSWDASSDLLSPPTLDSSGMIQMDSDSRPSSGFYSVSGSSLSDSCYSVSSEAALGLPAPPHAKPLRQWEQGSVPGDHSDIRWSEIAGRQQSQAVEHSSQEDTDVIGRGLVSGDFEAVGLSFLSDLCSSLSDPQPSTLMSLLNPSSSSSPHLRAQLDPKYCTDLVSRRTKEVYSYPSPLHAVALQSPLFTPQGHETSASASPEGPSPEEAPDPATVTSVQSLASVPSLTQLEQYISRLAHQYRNRASSSTSDLTLASTPGPASNSALRTPGKSHGSTQSLSAFESRSAPSPMPLLGSVTPCKSLLGNSARVSLSSIGKKASRNSINLGNLPSATGEDLNISLHLNLNLNLAPGLNGSLGLVENTKNGSCGALRNDLSTATSATSLSSSSATPGLRARSRISTCPSTLSHRSSLEVAPGTVGTSGIGSQSFCRSLDWSSSAPAGAGAAAGITSGSAPGSQRSSFTHDSSPSPKLSEDMAMVDEIVRLSGLSRAVVVGLMEQGVELDVDCFTEAGNEVRGHARQPGYPHRMTTHADQSHSRAKFHGASVVTDLNPQRPAQLSLSVTHSPQSHAGLTPPLSRSPQSHASITPPLSHASSPIHPYQSAHTPTLLLFSSIHSNYQQTPSHSEPPSSTASSPASRPNTRGHSPPRPLQPSPLGSTPLSVFRRDTPSQCSLPRVGAAASAPAVRPRGGSLRQSPDAYGGGGSVSSGGWRRSEGEGLYRGKHVSRELVRASTVSSYAHGENYSYVWGEEEHEGDEPARQREPLATKRTSGKLWRGWGKESDSEREKMDRAEYGYGWRRNNNGSWKRECQRAQATCGSKDKRPTVDSSSNRRGKGSWDKRSSSLRLSRRTLFRSESQGLLAPCTRRQEPMRPTQWVSSLDVARSGLGLDAEDGVRPLGEVDKRLSSTTSLFNLSLSQSLEGSCHSLSPPLSSPSFSPSPPPRALQRSRSLRDLGKRVFGSMRSLSLKKKTSKK